MMLNGMLILDRGYCKAMSTQVQLQTSDFYYIKSKQTKQNRPGWKCSEQIRRSKIYLNISFWTGIDADVPPS